MSRSRLAGAGLLAVSLAVAGSLVAGAADNALTEQERAAGWVLLFDGATTRGWMTPTSQPLPARHVQDESLNPHPCDYMLVQERPWDNFQLSLDFKISPQCNSGIFVRTFPLAAASRQGRRFQRN